MSPDQKFKQLGKITAGRGRTSGKAYTRLVRFLRLALPMLALAVVALLFTWPQMDDTIAPLGIEEELIPQNVAKNELLNPRFESTDDDNQPYTITATRAVQSADDSEMIILERPMADLTMNSGSWIAAEAYNGAYRQHVETLLLQGNVTLFHDKGYEMKTEKLLVNLKTRHATSTVAVHGQGPAGTIVATGVSASADDGNLIFTGPVKLVLNRTVDGL